MSGRKANGRAKSQLYIGNLTNIFIKSSLQKLSLFYRDEAQASILFKKLNQYEVYYLVTFLNIVKSNKLQSFFKTSIQVYLQEVKALILRETRYTIKVKVVNKSSGELSDVLVSKVPIYKQTHEENKYSEQLSAHFDELSLSSTSTKIKKKYVHGRSANEKSNQTSAKPKRTCDEDTIKIDSEKFSIRSKLNRILFQPGEDKSINSDMENENENKMVPYNMEVESSTVSKVKNKNLRPREQERMKKMMSKLQEDLLVPVKCDKAVKIMQSMGWDGGALGLHGDGLVEPIMPELGYGEGAGLGHSDWSRSGM